MKVDDGRIRIRIVGVGVGQAVTALENLPAVGTVIRHIAMNEAGRDPQRAGEVYEVNAEKRQDGED